MHHIARFLVHRSKLVLGITGLVTVVAVAMLFRLDFNADIASFILEGSPPGQELAALQDKYESTDPINVVASLPEGESFVDKENLLLLLELRSALSDVEGVELVASLIPDTNPLTGGPIDSNTILATPAILLPRLVSLNPLSELLLSANGQHTMLIVTPHGDVTAVAREVTDVTVDGLDVVYSGNPVIFASVIDLLSIFLLVIPPLVVLLLVGTFYANIGDRRLSALAVVPAILGSVWTFGLIFGLGLKADIVTVIVPIFVIVMGSADGLHFVTHFQDEAENPDPVGRVASALSHVGIPMILTTISTAAGFLSLLATDVEPIRQLGLFTAIGIGFAGIVSFFALPALISHVRVEPAHRTALLGPGVVRLLKTAVRSRVPAVVLTAAVVGFGLFAVPRLDVNPDQLFFFKSDDPVRVAFDRTEEIFGGATPMMGEFVFDPAGPPEQLDAINELAREMEQLPGVRTVFSIANLAGDLAPEQWAAVFAGEFDFPLGEMVSDDGMRFMLLPGDFGSDDIAAWVQFGEERDEIRVLTGMPLVWDEIARVVLEAQGISLMVAFVLVAALLALAYRRLRETLASLVPIALTVVAVLGFIAVSNIQLNLMTAVVSSIILGVGIDYAIHFVAAIDIARKDGPGYVLRAIDRAGRPIVANALGIAIALSALWFSPLAIHGQVSMIMWVGMVVAAAAALTVIPAMLPRAGVNSSPG